MLRGLGEELRAAAAEAAAAAAAEAAGAAGVVSAVHHMNGEWLRSLTLQRPNDDTLSSALRNHGVFVLPCAVTRSAASTLGALLERAVSRVHASGELWRFERIHLWSTGRWELVQPSSSVDMRGQNIR